MGVLSFALILVTAQVSSAQKDPRSDSYDALVLDATEHLKRGDTVGALTITERAERLRPDDAPAYIVKGMVLFKLGRGRESGPEFLRGVKLAKARSERRQYIETIENVTGAFGSGEESRLVAGAVTSHRQGNLSQAEKGLSEALRLNANNATTWFELGRVQMDRQALPLAVASLEKARVLNPASPTLLEELRHCYTDVRQYEKARAVLEDEIAIGGDRPDLLQERGFIYASEGNVGKAIEALNAVITRFPAYAPPYYTLGQIYSDLRKDRRKAADYFCLFLKKAAAGDGAFEGVSIESQRALLDSARQQCDDSTKSRGSSGPAK